MLSPPYDSWRLAMPCSRKIPDSDAVEDLPPTRGSVPSRRHSEPWSERDFFSAARLDNLVGDFAKADVRPS